MRCLRQGLSGRRHRDYKQQEQVLEFDVGAIIVATAMIFSMHQDPEYGYGRLPNVVTALEFRTVPLRSGPTHGHVYRVRT